MSLRQTILEAFQAISLILVFITVFFNLKYHLIIEDLNKSIPNGRIAQKKESKRLLKSFWGNCFVLLIMSGVSFYLLLPLSIKVIINTDLKLWNFDILYTSYIFIVFWLGIVFIWSGKLSIKLLNKIYKIKNKYD